MQDSIGVRKRGVFSEYFLEEKKTKVEWTNKRENENSKRQNLISIHQSNIKSLSYIKIKLFQKSRQLNIFGYT